MPFFRIFVASSLLPVAAIASACGDSDSTATGSGTSLADVPGILAPAVCDTAAQCYGPLLDAILGGNSCTGYLTKQIQQGDFSLVDEAVSKGTVKYDGTKVSDCVDAIKQKGCAILSTRLSTLCSGALQGTVAAGQSCTIGEECAPGLFCKTTTCPGVCTSLLAEGISCESDGDCQDGLSCDNDTKACKKATGADLTAAEGDTCNPLTAKFCQSGLACAGVSITAGMADFKCEKPATGATCHVAFPEECPSGQFCKLPSSTLEGACTPIPKAGETCGRYSAGDKRAVCAPGSICDTASDKCVEFQDIAGACTADNQCYSKACGDAGSCVAAKCAK